MTNPKGNSQPPDEQFNADSFLPAVSDDKGHNVHMSLRYQPNWGRQLDLILRDRRYPYVSTADIIRHALSRHFTWLAGRPGGDIPKSVLGQISLAQELLEDDRRQQAFGQLLDTLRERVSAHRATGSLKEARKHVLGCLRHIKRMPAGYWREKFDKQVRKEYDELLDAAPKVSLTALSKGG